jgi:hypothetical protein
MSPKTIKRYTASVRPLATFLGDQDMPDGIEDVTPSTCAFLLAERERTSPAFAGHQRWLSRFTEAEITALLRARNGQDFESRRDAAIGGEQARECLPRRASPSASGELLAELRQRRRDDHGSA